MSRLLDKYIYTTNYKQDFCVRQSIQREVGWVPTVNDCKPRFVAGIATGIDINDHNLPSSCPCQSGGLMPQRGAVASGLPTNLNKCPCFTSPKKPVERIIKYNEQRESNKFPSPEISITYDNLPPQISQQPIDRKEKKKTPKTCPKITSPKFEPLRPLPRGKFGGQREGRPHNVNRSEEEKSQAHKNTVPCTAKQNASPSDIRIPGPFWRQKMDSSEKKRKFEGSEIPEDQRYSGKSGGKHQSDLPRICQTNSNTHAHGAARMQDIRKDQEKRKRHSTQYDSRDGNVDERREPDIDRKKKFDKDRNDGNGIMGGDEFRGQWRDDRPEHGSPADDNESADEDQSQPFPYKRACKCAAQQSPGGWNSWQQDEDPHVPRDVEKTIRQVPEARLSCVPAAEPSKFDQPNTFMKKLYEKYPYLYKVLKETPPEELVSKVFKDRFLSTYQIDYLHMGIGKEQYPGGGAEKEEVYTGPDGEPEPKTIPGCSYRVSKKGDFGRKKTVYDKKDKEEEYVQVKKEEPRVSEYMATISRLGGEIITDQLYNVAQITKTMKNQYNNM